MIIYGASDDLIEIERANGNDEEFNAYECTTLIEVSDGTEIQFDYIGAGIDGEFIWKSTIFRKGNKFVRVKDAPAPIKDHEPPHANIPSYTDIVIIEDDGTLEVKVTNKHTS